MPQSRTDAAEEARSDMTPMIDAVFLLIIFFLCIDFRTLEARLPANLPKDRGSSNAVVAPVEQLVIRIVCDEFGEKQPRVAGLPVVDASTGRTNPFVLTGHRIHWTVGPTRVDDVRRLTRELDRVANDPSGRAVDRRSQSSLLPVVVEPGPGATYGDVALTVDALRASGFDDISFGGGL